MKNLKQTLAVIFILSILLTGQAYAFDGVGALNKNQALKVINILMQSKEIKQSFGTFQTKDSPIILLKGKKRTYSVIVGNENFPEISDLSTVMVDGVSLQSILDATK